MPWWIPLVPCALLTLYVWVEVVRAVIFRRMIDQRVVIFRRMVDQVRAQHGGLDTRTQRPPCAFCHSQTHTYREHVRIPQAELAARQDDEAWRCEGEW